MTDPTQVHAEQIAYWNSIAGQRWATRQTQIDAMLAPLTDAVLAAAAPAPGARVLDIGCGCGATTLALAKRLPRGHVTGLDVSAPMLEVAARLGAGAANVTWLEADAAAHRFAPGAFDLLFSRFGVMFFGDPTAAFANLRAGARRGARLFFACWQSLADNPWMQVPLAAALAHLPPPAPPAPEAPGPFAFADRARVARILTGAGWRAPRFTPFGFPVDLGGGRGLDAAVDQTTKIGAAARAMAEQPEAVRAAATASIRAALAPHAHDDGRVTLAGAVWLVESANP
ncbi:MAG: class I SAM-dependent methyltransferase [Alphaproteobacteria bacterium]|nr:class I SAM-dependent methyltransferase [Alphaproteobacteria bacterium]